MFMVIVTYSVLVCRWTFIGSSFAKLPKKREAGCWVSGFCFSDIYSYVQGNYLDTADYLALGILEF